MISFSLTHCAYLGTAMTQNPGYLKLRKIKAAQHIAQTVKIIEILNIITNDSLHRYPVLRIEYI